MVHCPYYYLTHTYSEMILKNQELMGILEKNAKKNFTVPICFICMDTLCIFCICQAAEVIVKVLFYSCYLSAKKPANMDNVCGVFLLFVFGGQPFYFRRVREIIIEPSLGNSQRLFSLSCSRLLQGKVETIGFHMAFEK